MKQICDPTLARHTQRFDQIRPCSSANPCTQFRQLGGCDIDPIKPRSSLASVDAHIDLLVAKSKPQSA